MNFFNEYGLLVAVALPVVAIVGLQVFLYIAGERETGLLPGMGSYPSIDIGKVAEAAPMRTSETPTIVITVASSNDEEERLAA